MSEKSISHELTAIEAALGGLTPAASRIARDRLMYLAGCASAERSLLRRRATASIWSGAIGAMLATTISVAAAVLFTLWVERVAPVAGRDSAHVVPSPAPATQGDAMETDAADTETLAHGSYRAAMRGWIAELERSEKLANIEVPDYLASAADWGPGGGRCPSLHDLLLELDVDRAQQPLKSQHSHREENP